MLVRVFSQGVMRTRGLTPRRAKSTRDWLEPALAKECGEHFQRITDRTVTWQQQNHSG